MKVHSLMYHDVVQGRGREARGYPGPARATYNVSIAEFAQHLSAVHRAGVPVGRATEPLVDGSTIFTFDDGGIGAFTAVIGMLEQRGWSGHFFITTDWIGNPGSLSRAQICELHRRGHIVGSHSCSHPASMASCSRQQLAHEWGDSVKALQDMLGAPVTVASVPHGSYSEEVGRAAAEAGIRVLFTSRPTANVQHVDRCMVLGRYAVKHGFTAALVANLASGVATARWKQWLVWQAKRAGRRVGGRAYLRLREWVLAGGR